MRRLLIFTISCALIFGACGGNNSVTAPDNEAAFAAGQVQEDVSAAGMNAIPLSINKQVYYYCKIVQQAVEDFAASNQGYYPSDADCDATPQGDTLVDLLPGGCLLENIFTGAFTEPVHGTSAQPGEIGYMVCMHYGKKTGYLITGCGKKAMHPIVTICKDAATGEITEIVGRNR